MTQPLLLPAVLALFLSLAPNDEEAVVKPVALIGAVKSRQEGEHSVDFKAKGGPYEVQWNNQTVFLKHDSAPLSSLEAGTSLHILGFHQDAQPGELGGEYPPMIIRVSAVVAGSPFDPPAVPAKLAATGIKWLEGDLQKDQKELRLGQIAIATGRDRPILKVEKVNHEAVAEKQSVFVAGYLDDSDRRHKIIKATEIIILAAKFTGNEYSLCYDFANRKPEPLAKKDDKKDGKKTGKPDF